MGRRGSMRNHFRCAGLPFCGGSLSRCDLLPEHFSFIGIACGILDILDRTGHATLERWFSMLEVKHLVYMHVIFLVNSFSAYAHWYFQLS